MTLLAMLAVLVAAGASRSAQPNAVNQEHSIQATVQGAFSKAPTPAGEHTGFQISASGLIWEVDVPRQSTLRDAAERLAGSLVRVRGTYVERRAPRVRRILTAEELAGATQSAVAEYIDVIVRGTITTGLMAIGGETTGATIRAGAVTWELDLEDGQRDIAERLNGRTATVSGALRHARGVEIRNRTIVKVRRIE